MKLKILQISFSFLLVLCASVFAGAQTDATTPNGMPRKEDYPKNIKETLKKQEIERNKKDYDEMLKNGEEAAKLSEELAASFDKNQKLSGKDKEKIERIEKLVKKIRKELGGDSDADEEVKPSTMEAAVKSLRNTTFSLLDELKKTTRYSISVVAIQSSNSLLNIVRFLKFWE